MERAELVELLSPEGLRLLDAMPPYRSIQDVVRTVSDLRAAGHPPGLVATVLTQAKLRARAVAKFGDFADRMLFTQAGLEQATRLTVASAHAGRYVRAGITRVADLGCGIGGDAMALAAMDLHVTAVERDEVTAAIASYNLAPFPDAEVICCEAEKADLGAVDAVYLDPARRTAGHAETERLHDPAAYSPPLAFALELATRMPTGVKLGPGLDRDVIPHDAEAQWVSVDGQVVEMGLWFGPLARVDVRRSALVIGTDGTAELTADADSEDAEVGAIGDYLYEPDGAIIRARLIGALVRSLHARMIGAGIAYFTADELVPTPFATAFRVLDAVPFEERALAKELRRRDIGTLEIKKRGVRVDPAQLRKRLNLRGSQSATVVLTRAGGRHTAFLVERA